MSFYVKPDNLLTYYSRREELKTKYRREIQVLPLNFACNRVKVMRLTVADMRL